MSQVEHNVQKKEGLKNTKRAKKESTQAKSGRKKKPSSSENTRPVGTAEIKVRFPITLIMRFTENQNTSYLQASGVYVTHATLDYTSGGSCVLDVRGLMQSQKANDAFLALINPILKELSTYKNTNNESATNEIGKVIESSTRKKKSVTGSG